MNLGNSSQAENGIPRGGEDDDPRLPDLAWIRQAKAEKKLLVEIENRVRRRTRRRWAVVAGAATAALVVAGVSWNLQRSHRTVVSPATQVVTRVWSPTTQTLPDGSVVEMRDGARVDVRFDDALRRVILEAGEAHFVVAKSAKPFVVEAGGVAVKAVGTEFSVQLDTSRVEVLVTAGQVRLERTTVVSADTFLENGQSRAEPVDAPLLGAGDHGLVTANSPAPQITVVSEEQITQRLAWRNPMLEFLGTPLAEVIALMNQHAVGKSKVRFELANPGLGELRLSGFLRSDNSEGLIRLLEENFGIESTRSGSTITLRKAER